MRPRLRAAVSAAIVIGGYSRLLSKLAPADIAAVHCRSSKGATSSSAGSSKHGSSRGADSRNSSSKGGSSSSKGGSSSTSGAGSSSKGAGSSSSSNNCNSSTTGLPTESVAEKSEESQQAGLAWQIACQYQQQLPALPAALTDMLGVDRPLLAWLAVQDAAAGESDVGRYAARVADLIMPGSRHAIEDKALVLTPAQQTAQGDHQQQQQQLRQLRQQLFRHQLRQQELYLSLAPLLFECAAGVEDGVGTIFRCDAHHVALISAIHTLERYVESLTKQHDVDSLVLLECGAAPQAAAAATALPEKSLVVQRMEAVQPILKVVLPPLLRLMARKLATVRAVEAAALHGSSGTALARAASSAAAAVALGDSSNGSSAAEAVAPAATFKQGHWFLVHSVSLLAHLSDSTVLLLPAQGLVNPSGGQSDSESTPGALCGARIAKAWSNNALQLTALCEGYLRALAAATAQGTAAATPQGTAAAAAAAQGATVNVGSDLLPQEGPWAVGLMSHWCSVGGRVDGTIPGLLAMAMQGFGQPPLCEPAPGHIQLLGLMGSLIKLTGCPGFVGWGPEDALIARHNAALACGSMLQLSVAHRDCGRGPMSGEQQQPAAGVAAAGADSMLRGSVTFPGLAWLVLFGRVCSQWADALSSFELVRLAQQEQPPWSPPVRVVRLLALYSRHRMGGPLRNVGEWLQLNEGALTAAGCSVQGVCQQLGVLQQRWQAACEAMEGQTAGGEEAGGGDAAAAAAVVVAELARSLRVFGAAVSSALPVPHFCNNPSCSNVNGASEVALVSGRSCICAGCKVARYCGRSCQRACWKVHKPVCQALAAAAAAQAASPGAGAHT